jgi:hypothetical protein
MRYGTVVRTTGKAPIKRRHCGTVVPAPENASLLISRCGMLWVYVWKDGKVYPFEPGEVTLW